jgi:hypothetical protein
VLLIYKPEGADERRWTFSPDQLMSSEAEALENVTGMTYEEIGQALIKGSAKARRALLWVYLKREDPTLRHAQVDPPVGSVGVDYEQHELVAIRDKLAEDTDMSDADRTAALAQLDSLITDSSPTSSTSPLLKSAS